MTIIDDFCNGVVNTISSVIRAAQSIVFMTSWDLFPSSTMMLTIAISQAIVCLLAVNLVYSMHISQQYRYFISMKVVSLLNFIVLGLLIVYSIGVLLNTSQLHRRLVRNPDQSIESVIMSKNPEVAERIARDYLMKEAVKEAADMQEQIMAMGKRHPKLESKINDALQKYQKYQKS